MRELKKNFYIDTNYKVIHEDEELLIIDKPAPLAVHAVGSYSELNLHTLLKKDPRWAHLSLKPVHRLDAETSGALIIAKTGEAARVLAKQFMEGQVHKKYEAVVFGCPLERRGEIVYPLGYDDSSGFQTVRIWDPEKGEAARTLFEAISSNGHYSYLSLQPLTGRTHQLRAHMAIFGHPIIGDKIYVDLKLFTRYVKHGLDDDMIFRLKLPRLALHASELGFRHPQSGKYCHFFAPLPPLIQDFMLVQGLK